MLWVALRFPGLAAPLLEPLAAWACQFTPRVSLEAPDALVAEVEGSLRYFGGRHGLACALQAGLVAMQVEFDLAFARTARAALWRARGGGLKLGELPVAVTGRDAAFFRAIGVSTLGEVMKLPREGLAQRCGQDFVVELDRALGRAAEPREFFLPPARFHAALELPTEVAHAEALFFAARRLLVQLAGLLAARHAGVHAFTLGLAHSNKTRSEVKIEFASVTREVERFSRLLREKLERLELAQPVAAISLDAADFAPLAGRSAGLFGDRAAEAEDWAALVERLQARLGRDAVHGITMFPDHRPEHAWRRVAPGDWDAHDFVQPGPRPAWLVEKVLPVEESELDLVAGPERIACGWWDGDDMRRDYFVAQYKASLAWVYREEGQWYVHGFFA
jgi:protein ImuB